MVTVADWLIMGLLFLGVMFVLAVAAAVLLWLVEKLLGLLFGWRRPPAEQETVGTCQTCGHPLVWVTSHTSASRGAWRHRYFSDSRCTRPIPKVAH